MQLSVLASLVLCHQGHKRLQDAAEVFRSTASNIEWSLVQLTTADGSLLVVVIPGTNDIPDVKMDVDIIRSAVRPKDGIRAYSDDPASTTASFLDAQFVLPYASYHAQVTWPEQRVHRGFYRGYLSIRDELLARVSESEEKVLIVGHSLGGAVGMLAAVDLNFNLGRPIHLVTLGSPRVGNAAFIDACQRRIASHTRLVHGWDPVPRHPWPVWGYRHHTKARHIGRWPVPLIPNIRHHLIASYDAMLARLNI
jgi:hypothetical protein